MNATDQETLQYVKEMTEAGRKAPLLGGRFYIFWGVLLSLCYFGQWAILSERFGLPPVSFLYLWGTFLLVAILGMPLLVRSLRHKPGKGAVNNQVETIVWSRSGFGLFTFAIGVVLSQVLVDAPPTNWDFIVALGLSAYCVALYTTGHISGLQWMQIPAALSGAAVAGVPILAGRPELYLYAAGVIAAVSVVPGIVLMLGEPKALVEDA